MRPLRRLTALVTTLLLAHLAFAAGAECRMPADRDAAAGTGAAHAHGGSGESHDMSSDESHDAAPNGADHRDTTQVCLSSAPCAVVLLAAGAPAAAPTGPAGHLASAPRERAPASPDTAPEPPPPRA